MDSHYSILLCLLFLFSVQGHYSSKELENNSIETDRNSNEQQFITDGKILLSNGVQGKTNEVIQNGSRTKIEKIETGKMMRKLIQSYHRTNKEKTNGTKGTSKEKEKYKRRKQSKGKEIGHENSNNRRRKNKNKQTKERKSSKKYKRKKDKRREKQNKKRKKKNKKKKKKKSKRRKKVKKKKPRNNHPRKQLKFDTNCECGVSKKQRIVNGQESGAGDWPWMVTLEDKFGSYYCGGSIISSRYILTAAHCISYKGEKVFVVIGDHDKNDDGETVTKRIKGRAIPHKDYNPNTMENDVAIIRLNEEIDFSLYNGDVGPVCLAQKDGGDYDNVPVTATGWGTLYSNGPQATVLMEVDLETITNKQCGEDYYYEKEAIKDSMLCTVAPGKDACQGDSGGPLVTWDKDRGRYVQIGVVSWGAGCAEKEFPGVFARVTRLERWILNQAKKSGKFCSEDA